MSIFDLGVSAGRAWRSGWPQAMAGSLRVPHQTSLLQCNVHCRSVPIDSVNNIYSGYCNARLDREAVGEMEVTESGYCNRERCGKWLVSD